MTMENSALNYRLLGTIGCLERQAVVQHAVGVAVVDVAGKHRL
jgi:hypothetical protein